MNVRNHPSPVPTAVSRVAATKNALNQRNQLFASIVIKKVMEEVVALNPQSLKYASTAKKKAVQFLSAQSLPQDHAQIVKKWVIG